MLSGLWIILILLIFSAIVKSSRRLLYDDFVIDANNDEFIKQIEKLSFSFTLPSKHGKGAEARGLKPFIKKAHRIITKKIKKGENLYEYEKWLYDNYYVFVRKLDNIDGESFYKLPHANGVPRVISFARVLVAYSNCKVTKERVNLAVNCVNKIAPFTIKETNALENAIAYALLEKISSISRKCVYYRKIFRVAVKGKNLIKSYLKSNLYLYYTLKTNPKLAGKLKQYLDKNSLDYDNIDYVFSMLIIENNILTSSMVESLQNLSDRTDGLLLKSPISVILNKDAIFRDTDSRSKLEYLFEIAKQSDKINLAEQEYATALLKLQSIKEIHFGIFLFEHKKEVMHFAKTGRVLTLVNKKPKAEKIYVASVFAINIVLCGLLGYLTNILWLGIVLGIIGFFALMKPSTDLVNRVTKWFVKARPLIRMCYDDISDEAQTLVVVPVFIGSADELTKNIRHIKELKSGNNFKCAEFMLLIDFKPSKSEKDESDILLIDILKKEFSANDKIGAIVRKRTENGGKYSGYERKRGAVEALVSGLYTNSNEFVAFQTKQFSRPVYCVVLDADNTLAPQGVLRAVNAIMHPMNEKYDLLTIEARTNMFSIKTPYSKQFMHDSGIECYPEYSSFYYNLCGKGIFQGKGVFRLDRFYAKLNGRLPENKILSHDIIEGAILETGISGEVTYEEAPENFFADIGRKTRWARGDIQLLPFINFTKNADKSNKISLLYRFIIFNNAFSVLYESIVATLAIVALFINNMNLMAFVGGILGIEFVLNTVGAVFSLLNKRRIRYVLGDIVFNIYELFKRVFSVPFYAVNGLSIFCTTLFRMIVTKKGLLNWKPFCAGEKTGGMQYIRLFAQSIIFMSVVTGLSFLTTYFWYVVGYFLMMQLTYSIISWSGEKVVSENPKCAKLMDYAKITYKYFERFSTDGLIADNFQLAPKGEMANYTSPTNIGFSILAHISAYSLGIIERDVAEKRVIETLQAVDKLEKWKGHLYNWYDTTTKQPLAPRFVSSVDSGNYVASLLTAKAVFVGEIAKLIDKQLKNIEFDVFFDKTKQQFYIGFNECDNNFEGHYDGLISEARLLSYIAITLGAGKSAWDSLSRDLVSAHGNTLMSWSGTVFEYLMAELFFDTPKMSLLGKTCKRAVSEFIKTDCQGFWGISESGYFKFDNLKNYQYYAFGIDSLSLRSELNQCVISPYSSFLCLPYKPYAVLNNIKKLVKSEMVGEFGFFEAIDFINQPRIVLEYMAHHQGMIMCAITNALSDNFIKKAFMSNLNVSGAKLLLTERNIETRSKKPQKNKFKYKNSNYEDFCIESTEHFDIPLFNSLKSDEYGILLDDRGRGYSKWRDIYINRFRCDNNRDFGAFFYVLDKETKQCDSPTLAPQYKKSSYKAQFKKAECVFLNESAGISEHIYAPNFFNGELRRLTVENFTDETKTYKIAFYSELSLNDIESDISHTAFSNMFVETSLTDGVLYATRKYLSGDKKLYSAMLVKGASKIRYITNRFNFIGRGKSLKNPLALSTVGACADDIGTVLEPCFGFTAEITVLPKSHADIDVTIAVSDTLEKINAEVSRAKSSHFLEFIRKVPYVVENNSSYTLDNFHSKQLSKLVGRLLYIPYEQQKMLNICANHADFVRYSENFNRKVLLFKYENGQTEALKQAVNMLNLLNDLGIKTSLLIWYVERDSYFEPIKNEAFNAISKGIIGRELFFIKSIDVKYDDLQKIAFYDFSELNGCDEKINRLNFLALKKFEINRVSLLNSGEGYISERGYEIVPIGLRTMLPYSNVICGECGGTLVTDCGGYTYSDNSRENKISVWSNDPVLDTPSEWLYYICDDKCARLNGEVGACVTHSRGITEMFSSVDDFNSKVAQFIIDDGKNKVYEIDIYAFKKICGKLVLSLDLVLGAVANSNFIYFKLENDLLHAINLANGQSVYLKVFNGTYGENTFSAQYEICFEKDTQKKLYFVIGSDFDAISELSVFDIENKKQESLEYFNNLNKFSIKSGNLPLDFLFNDWLMYQVVSCRINGRTAFYQAGGAVGFRDQLQDCLALIYSNPIRARQLILEIAKHVYAEGDVMHWWHSEKHGVRTRISDDRLFLPYVVAEYIQATGDKAILDIELLYLFSNPLAPNEKSRYENPKYTSNPESLKMHLERIVESAYRIGDNGLLLIDGGDWNDALDNVGNSFDGESVWLTMFCYSVLDKMEKYYEGSERMIFVNRKNELKTAIERCFTGKQYKRLITKDGEWLGADGDGACGIDIISQAWASLSNACDKKQVNIALNTAKKRLFDHNNNLIMLLTPPFDYKKYYGYISSYPKGVRENGGQYTHGAIWYIMALIKENRVDEAYELFSAINPLEKCISSEETKKYKAEPYVISADVYTNPQNLGRAGWSWYTGSASWCYKLILEDFLGIRLCGDKIEVKPKLPTALNCVEVEYRFKKSIYKLKLIKNGKEAFFENNIEVKNGNLIVLADNVKRYFEVWCK
ncbi:MAG: glucoamylase family protein [Clostridia bacterium]